MSESEALIGELRDLATRYGAAPAEVLPTRPDVTVVRAGAVVVKAHSPGTARAPLERRIRAAAHPALREIMLQPVTGEILVAGDRLVTVWPAGTPVDPRSPQAAPWEEAARLLARLHAVPPRALPPLPPAGGPARVATTVARLDPGSPAGILVRRTLACLPPPADGPGSLTHGDWHMGQMVRLRGEWLLIDVDDLGTGDPAWDLARPAAWFAAGLLEPEVWHRFLAAYRAEGGHAAGTGDPWPRLDLPAQALTVQLTAAAVAKAEHEGRPPDEVERVLLDTCRRIVRFRDACHSVPTQ